MKKRIVLDCSALRSVPTDEMMRLGDKWSGLLCPELFRELYTRDLLSLEGLAEAKKADIAQRAYQDLKRTADVIRLEEIKDPGRFEVETGRPASQASRLPLCIPADPPQTHEHDWLMFQQKEEAYCFFGEFPPAKGFKDTLRNLRDLEEHQFWPELAGLLMTLESWIASEARQMYIDMASSKGWKPSPAFQPDRHFYCFGAMALTVAQLDAKFWKHGSSAPGRKDKVNLAADAQYVALVAIADGFLSADKQQLNLAWSCWPERRDDLYIYDMSQKRIRKYVPAWNSQGRRGST